MVSVTEFENSAVVILSIILFVWADAGLMKNIDPVMAVAFSRFLLLIRLFGPLSPSSDILNAVVATVIKVSQRCNKSDRFRMARRSKRQML